jgi:diguanylate cyclase (GGDEF)-like protein
MSKLVDALADLSALRDREELEILMALGAAELLGASAAILWRLAGPPDGLRLHERAMLIDRSITISEMPFDIRDLPPLDSRPDLRDCYDREVSAAVEPDENGPRRHVFPMISAKGVVGFLVIFRLRPLRDDQARLMTSLLRIYHNHLKLLDYSENDELTGLLNRKTFEASFAQLTQSQKPPPPIALPVVRIERRRPVNPDRPRWLAVTDIDLFKRINDRCGHPCGDAVLVQLARLMVASFRESDRLFRSGGEEFVVILDPTEAQYVGAVLERFRAVVEAFDFPQVGPVTISVGFTCVIAGDTALTAFSRADEALYAAKRQGRNQVICYEELTTGEILPSTPLAETAALAF